MYIPYRYLHIKNYNIHQPPIVYRKNPYEYALASDCRFLNIYYIQSVTGLLTSSIQCVGGASSEESADQDHDHRPLGP